MPSAGCFAVVSCIFLIVGGAFLIGGVLELHTALDWEHNSSKDQCQVLDVAESYCTYDCHCTSDSSGGESCDTCSGSVYHYKLSAEPCTGDTFTHHTTCGNGRPYVLLSNHTCWVKDDCSEIDLTSPHTHKVAGIVLTSIGAVVLSPCVFVSVFFVGYLLWDVVKRCDVSCPDCGALCEWLGSCWRGRRRGGGGGGGLAHQDEGFQSYNTNARYTDVEHSAEASAPPAHQQATMHTNGVSRLTYGGENSLFSQNNPSAPPQPRCG